MSSRAYSRSPSPECAVEDSAEYWNNHHYAPHARAGALGAQGAGKGASWAPRRSASPEVTSPARASFDAPSRSSSPALEHDVVLSTNECLCATTIAAMCVQVFRGVMTTREMALGVLAMWATSLAARSAFGNGISMDSNTPPPDRVVLLVIKLVFTIARWAVMTLVRAPLKTTATLHRRAWHRAVDEGWDDDCAATVAAKDLADDVRECVTNKDYEDFARAIANDEGEWDVIASGKVGACTYRMLRGVSAEDREAMKTGIAKFRTEVLMAGVSADVLFDAQTDLLGRQEWDSTTLHPTQVEREARAEGHNFAARDVVYWRLRYPRLMAPRDYIVARRQWRDSKNSTLTCICRDALSAPSALNAMKALQRGMGCQAVDVKRMYSAVMVGPSADVNGSQYVSIYYEDPGVPPRIAHMAAAKGLDRYMATFEREIQRRARAGTRRDLSDVPPPPSVERDMASVSFTTGRVSVPQSDDEGDDGDDCRGGGGAPTVLDSTNDPASTSPHFAPTNASREYRFRGHDGLGKRQRIRRRIGRFIRVMQDLVDPKAPQRQAALFVDEDDDQRHSVQPIRGRKRRWLKRAAFGALVWISRGGRGE